jgi:hypothetical protein
VALVVHALGAFALTPMALIVDTRVLARSVHVALVVDALVVQLVTVTPFVVTLCPHLVACTGRLPRRHSAYRRLVMVVTSMLAPRSSTPDNCWPYSIIA